MSLRTSTRRGLLALTVIAASVLAPSTSGRAATPSQPVIIRQETIGPPDARATDFGGSPFVTAPRYSTDGEHIAASARLDGGRVAYVFDRSPSGWAPSATIEPAADATDAWGDAVAIHGDLLAVGDPEYDGGRPAMGRVTLYARQGTTWAVLQTIDGAEFNRFGAGVWLADGGLVVRHAGECDASCYYGRWTVYQPDDRGTFAKTYDSLSTGRTGRDLSVGIDGARVALANPGFVDDFTLEPRDNFLTVLDLSTTPPTTLVERRAPLADAPFGPIVREGWYREVALADGSLIYERCCSNGSELHVERDTGSGYQPEAVLPIDGPSESVVSTGEVILRADRTTGSWHTLVRGGGTWTAGADIAAPDAVAAGFRSPVIAVDDQVLVGGDGVLHLLTIGAEPDPPVPTCAGRPATVELAKGQRPTVGADVVVGTDGFDLIDARAGNDVVCGLGGTDLILGSGGDDELDGGAGIDLLVGGTGRDLCRGGPGFDLALSCERRPEAP